MLWWLTRPRSQSPLSQEGSRGSCRKSHLARVPSRMCFREAVTILLQDTPRTSTSAHDWRGFDFLIFFLPSPSCWGLNPETCLLGNCTTTRLHPRPFRRFWEPLLLLTESVSPSVKEEVGIWLTLFSLCLRQRTGEPENQRPEAFVESAVSESSQSRPTSPTLQQTPLLPLPTRSQNQTAAFQA